MKCDNETTSTAEKSNEFAQFLLYVLKNVDIVRGFRDALGIHEQLAGIHQELTHLRNTVQE